MSMQNCVCTKSAPASALASRPFGFQSGVGSCGTSAAPIASLMPCLISTPVGSLLSVRMRCAISIRSRLFRSNTALVSGWSPFFGSSPASTRMLWMPSADAPIRSPCSASRFRSRQVIWKIGSMPLFSRKCEATRLDRCALAPAPSVTLTAAARPFSGFARSRKSAGSVEIGGVTSAVTTKSPAFSFSRSWLTKKSYHRDSSHPFRFTLPELPDVAIYIESLERRILGARLQKVRLLNPFLLRTAVPPIGTAEGKKVLAIRRIGKRIVLALEDELFLVIHLMIAGRFQWESKRKGLAVFEFDAGKLTLTEAGTKRRASLHLVQGEAALAAMDPGGIDVFRSTAAEFSGRLKSENHTVKRALTDPHLFSGIGNAYSDEILHR